MKFRLLLSIVSVTFFLLLLTTAVMAQEEPPSPYTGLKNPFPWDDATAQKEGKGIYQRSCLGCHGLDGGNIAAADFSTPDYSQRLEARADFHFWLLSEGSLAKGMPSFKSSLSEKQRWQVLTYIWSLGEASSKEPLPPPQPPAEVSGTLLLTVPEKAQSGQPLILTAILQDKEGKFIGSATVKFFIRVDFFASGLMEIGDALTNDQGVAKFEYTTRQTGDIEVVARYEANETATILTLAESNSPFYQPKAGIRLPASGEPVFIGPKSALELGEESIAPTSAFYLPGGILSWLLLVVVTVMLIWFTYFRVMYQVFRIPIASEIGDTNTRLVPLVGVAIVVTLGIVLVMMLITGPYTHLHLLR